MKGGTIEKGELFTIAVGEYSDYRIRMLARALRDFDCTRAIADYESTVKQGPYSFDDMAFCAWLSANGYIDDVRYREWHIEEYGQVTNKLSGPDDEDEEDDEE